MYIIFLLHDWDHEYMCQKGRFWCSDRPAVARRIKEHRVTCQCMYCSESNMRRL
ncbi:hypothetical protein BDW66DRAFT_145761 [Aspergillus desertorum]